MRFTINREEFIKGLTIAGRAISPKSFNAALNNYKIELNETGLYIIGSNQEISIKTQIPFKLNDKEIIRNYKEGVVLVDKNIIELIKKLEDDEIIFDVIDNTIVTLSDSSKDAKLQCMRAEEYPDLDLDPTGTQLTLNKEDLSVMINQTAFAASTKEQRKILMAVNLEAAGGLLVATATDASRMAKKEIKIADDINFVANIPAKMIVEVDHLLENSSTVDISISETKALFKFNRTVVATTLIAAPYPNTKNIVPRLINYTLEVKSNEFLKAIDFVKTLSERENVVDLSMSDSEIEISTKNSQTGSASVKISDFKYEGQPLKISFNSDFAFSAIRALGSDDVTLGFVGEMKPFVIKNVNDESIIQIVTPIRTY